MAMCASCSGRGSVSCYSCYGRKFHQRPDSSGGMDVVPCSACMGTGGTRCQFCGGTGKVPDAGGAAPEWRSGGTHDDAVAGRWNASQGGSYEFVKQGSRYSLTEYGQFGPTGKGTATVTGHIVTLNFTNAVLGRVSLRLRLSGNTMQGAVNMMGMSMPFMLTRG